MRKVIKCCSLMTWLSDGVTHMEVMMCAANIATDPCFTEYDVISVKINNKISKCTTKVAHDITTVIVRH